MPDTQPTPPFGADNYDPELVRQIEAMQPIVDEAQRKKPPGEQAAFRTDRTRLVDARAALRDAQAHPGDA